MQIRIIIKYMLMRIICNNFMEMRNLLLDDCVVDTECVGISAKLKEGRGLMKNVGHGL
ncbi:hypothetical protein [Vibrio galatheae]|uniref:hypothetical protein n=1 Tax=Vibrio galatheae TaxID=579748 RepID=UPI000B0D0832|nr:hypothetical protein [Vibrio galatheae]